MIFTSTQSASPRDWVLNCIYVSLFIHSFIHLFIFFLLLFICFTYLIYINQVWHFCFWNRSIIAQHVFIPLKVPHRKIEFWSCIYVYLFIHSFTYSYFLFYYYLFVSLNLIYINQVWHFCFEIVQKYTPIYFHSKCVTAT